MIDFVFALTVGAVIGLSNAYNSYKIRSLEDKVQKTRCQCTLQSCFAGVIEKN